MRPVGTIIDFPDSPHADAVVRLVVEPENTQQDLLALQSLGLPLDTPIYGLELAVYMTKEEQATWSRLANDIALHRREEDEARHRLDTFLRNLITPERLQLMKAHSEPPITALEDDDEDED